MADSMLSAYTAICMANNTMYPDVAIFDLSSNTINRQIMHHAVESNVTGAAVYFTSSSYYYIGSEDMYIGELLFAGNTLLINGSTTNPTYIPFYGSVSNGYLSLRLQTNNSNSMTVSFNGQKSMNMQIYCFSH